MITIHSKDEIDFSKNGYGVLNKYINKENERGKWEMNGEYMIEFSIPTKAPLAKYVVEENIVQVPVPFMDRQLFRIYRAEVTLTDIYVTARHIFYDLLSNWIEDTNVVRQDGHSAISQILDRTLHPHRFVGSSNMMNTASARIVDMNPVAAILDDQRANTFVSRWGGEILRDNFHIELLDQLGVNRGVKIRHKRDLTGYSDSIDYSNIVTKILPIGFDGLKLPELYIESDLIDIYGPRVKEFRYRDVKAAVGEYAEDEDAIPLEEAYELLRLFAEEEFTRNHVDEPKTVIKVNFVALHNTEEYKELAVLQEVRRGDIVQIVSDDIDEINVTSRLVAFEFSLLQENHYYSTTLGNHVSDFTSSGPTGTDVIRKEIDEIRNKATTAINSADGRATNYYIEVDEEKPSLTTHTIRYGDRLYENVGDGQTIYYTWNKNNEWQIEKVSAGLISGTLDAENGDVDLINVNANSISAGDLNLAKGIRIGNDITPVMYMNEDGEVILNVQNLLINSFDPEADSVHQSDLLAYLRYTDGVVEIGETNAEVKTQFGNDMWAMLRNNERQMWLEEDIINIRKAYFFERLQVGNFGFVPRANGSLDLRKVVD